MRYIKEILKKNRIWVLVYTGLGIFNAFMANYKADYFQKVIDGLADRTLTFTGVAIYGFILIVNYNLSGLSNSPENKLLVLAAFSSWIGLNELGSILQWSSDVSLVFKTE